MDALRIGKAVIAGFDWGARTADIVAALWPERSKALVSVSGYLIGSREANRMPLPPKAELEWWYQFYFATERGRLGYEKNRNDFNRLIWQLASPKWKFDDATFARSAASFDNPDHVDIVIHNYRWRLGLAQGEAKFDALEKRLASAGGAISTHIPELLQVLTLSPTSFGTASLPPPSTAAALEGFRLLEKHPELVEQLHRNTAHLRERLESFGFETLGTTHVVPVLLPEDIHPKHFAKRLLEYHGVWVSAVWYVTKPRLRIVVNSLHTEQQIDQLVEALVAVRSSFERE